jgi:hypothetical protein
MNVRNRIRFRRATVHAVLISSLFAVGAVALAQNNECDLPGEEPDVIMSSIYQVTRWGRVGDITAFSVGTYSCNIGTCWAVWFPNNNQHPVITQNAFRLMDGKFEQIGQSWLKHGFFALSGNFCGPGCIPTNGQHLGVNCSDPYSSGLNGDQDRLGPKFEVNPHTGEFPYPATDLYLTGDAIFKRLQIHNDDMNPALNPEAKYYVESQYVAPDDAAAGNNHNNAGYREFIVTGTDPNYNMQLVGPDVTELPAIMAWADNDPEVEITILQAHDDGLFFLAAKATEVFPGLWNYEYAIENLDSNRAAREFRVPILPGATLDRVGFHDVDYHSGEPTDGTDWEWSIDESTMPHTLVWQTDTHAVNPDANALRWNTLYNFRFDTNLPPRYGEVELGLFLPGSPSKLLTRTIVPQLCNYNGVCDTGEEVCNCLDDCTPPVAELICGDREDNDCDGLMDCLDVDCCDGTECDTWDIDDDTYGVCDDCNDGNATIWGTPGYVQDVVWVDLLGQLTLSWSAPADLGGTTVEYEIVRSLDAADFMTDPTCLIAPDPSQTVYVDNQLPDPGDTFCYLVRAQNACPGELGEGGVGTDSAGVPRAAASCP